jgi:diguanylate cyclase (GGDEF)-like protein/PAS domain S-box-containing protein
MDALIMKSKKTVKSRTKSSPKSATLPDVHANASLPAALTKSEIRDEYSKLHNKYKKLFKNSSKNIKELKGLRTRAYAHDEAGQTYILADGNGNITDMNDAFLDIFGKTKKDWLGRHMFDLLTTRSRKEFQKEIEIGLEAKSCVWSGEIYCRKKGKKSFPASLKICAQKDKKGKTLSYTATLLDISEFKKTEKMLQQQAHFDMLTNLPNRTLMFDRFKQSVRIARRQQLNIAAMLIDLDRFKEVNDTLGHDAGDQLLIEVSKRLSYTVRESDTVARMGGDEFFVILPEIGSANDAAHIAQKFLNILTAPFLIQGHELFISASIGIAFYPTDGDDTESLVKHADTAMYHAKAQGKNNYKFFTEDINKSTVERFVLETRFRQALDKLEFNLNYQPKIDVKSGKISGMEALLRWYHPDQGSVQPSLFIPLAEETGLVLPLGEWALREACRQNKAWQDEGLRPLRISVNLSARQFRKRDLILTVKEILNDTGLEAKYLMLEITETTVIENVEETIETLNQFRDMGIGVSIDDFGTGYSSLNYLNKFPLDELKIDGSFIADLSNKENRKVVSAIIALGHGLNHKIVAEGVETKEQLDFLIEGECNEIQGYYLSRPLTSEKFHDLIKKDPTLI